MKLKIKAASPSARKSFWLKFVGAPPMRQSEFAAATEVFLDTNDRIMCQEYAELWLLEVVKMFSQSHPDMFTKFVQNLGPAYLGMEIHKAQIMEIIEKHKFDPSKNVLVQIMKKQVYELETVAKLRRMQSEKF
jgi:hypothetical protein